MTGASSGNVGDFHVMAEEMGAEMCEMEKIWGCQTFLEQSFEQWEDQVCLFQVRGDSMMIVNKRGLRVMNEKSGYDSRVRQHWTMEVPNQGGSTAFTLQRILLLNGFYSSSTSMYINTGWHCIHTLYFCLSSYPLYPVYPLGLTSRTQTPG
jgi:hypothetical protein